MLQPERTVRRNRIDRRKKPTNPMSWSSLRGQRRDVRREEDKNSHFYVDRYGPGIVIVCLTVVLFSITDAFLTLELVSQGGREINPFMNLALRFGPLPFLIVKYILTGSGVSWMLVHKEYRFLGGPLGGKHFIAIILFLYLLLVLYQYSLLSTIRAVGAG